MGAGSYDAMLMILSAGRGLPSLSTPGIFHGQRLAPTLVKPQPSEHIVSEVRVGEQRGDLVRKSSRTFE